MKRVYLVGFMGTGKSAVGRALAAKLGWRFVDLDRLIEEKESARIKDIFASKGEEYFRKAERLALQGVSGRQEALVVACGGGVVLAGENMALMKDTGRVICLTARPEIIFRRTAVSRRRPILNTDNPQAKIRQLLRQRARFYSQADRTIDTSDQTIENIAEQIKCYLLPKSPG